MYLLLKLQKTKRLMFVEFYFSNQCLLEMTENRKTNSEQMLEKCREILDLDNVAGFSCKVKGYMDYCYLHSQEKHLNHLYKQCPCVFLQ